MKATCSKDELLQNISIAEKTTGKNLTLPVLGCVLLDANEDGLLKIRATNIDLGIELSVPATIEEPGRVVVPGNILQNVVASMYDSSDITLSLSGDNLSLSSNKSKTIIKSFPTDDFPTLPEIEKEDVNFTLNAKDILRGLQSVWYSASTTTIKPELATVYMYSFDKKMYFVATDSFRLGEKTLSISKNIDMEPILIPIKNVAELMKVFEFLGDSDVEIHLNENQIVFTANGVYVTSRLVDGNFPDYKQILPKEFSVDVIVLKQDLINVFKKINIFSDKSNQVQFSIEPSKKKIILKSQNKDIGETTETLDAALSGDDLQISFNHKYITDCIQSINSDSISLSFTGLSRPMVMKGISDPSFLYLVMPMNK
jgi:DNA polymerase-3 subunit beta